MDLHDAGSRIEQIEESSIEIAERKMWLESRENQLSEAISILKDDIEVAGITEIRLSEVQQERSITEETIQQYQTEIETLQQSLSEIKEEYVNSKSVIDQLLELGENVSEGISILEERQILITECEEKLQEIIERLGLNSNVVSEISGTGREHITSGADENVESQLEKSTKEQPFSPDEGKHEKTNQILRTSNELPKNSSEAIGRLHYTDRLAKQMDLAEKDARLDKSRNIIRGRLASEYRLQANEMQLLENRLKEDFQKLENEYFSLAVSSNSQHKTLRIRELRESGNRLQKEIGDLSERKRYAQARAEYYAEGLTEKDKTNYVSLGDEGFIRTHGKLIQEQGHADPLFQGTCGLCSIANAATLLGYPYDESAVLSIARGEGLCSEEEAGINYSPASLSAITDNNGGTNVIDREKILKKLGFHCESKRRQSLDEMAEHLKEGKAAIIRLKSDFLDSENSAFFTGIKSPDHVVTITGYEVDSSGKIRGVWFHDTGNCSSMGNAFFCSESDYNKLKMNRECVIQYLWK